MNFQIGKQETQQDFIEDCLKEASASADMLVIDDSPQKLCFMKCMAEEQGLVDSDGNPITTIDEEYVETINAPVEKKKQYIQCLKNMKKIKKCEDMLQVNTCLMILPRYAGY